MSAEVAAINLGRVVATRAVGLWLGPRRREQEARSAMAELVRVRVPGLRAQRGVERQFEQIADAVAGRLEPLLAHEFRDLTDAGRQAALVAVIDAFTRADLSDEAVIGSDADPAELARRIRRTAPVPTGLDEPAARFHDLLFSECCDCYVRILRRLPVFTERAVTELLGRTTSLGADVTLVLERLPVRSLYAPGGTGQDDAFRREYLELISRSLDEVELFSFASERAPRAKLSVAYVSLRATGDAGPRPARPGPPLRTGAGAWADGEDDSPGVRVETALKNTARVLLRGEAGSGKTTLLQWLAVTAARGAFGGELADWNGRVPVLVKLRRYAGRELPLPEALLDSVAGPLTGHMPTAWLDRELAAGRVLLLVDGVDELLAGERRAVRDWLRGLLHAYPENQVVVTSRPAAARADWLRAEGFTALHLDRMRPPDLAAFIRQWHEAVREQGDQLPCAAEQLPHYERSLLTSLQDRPHLQSLATSPLLAALLCALHLNRRRQLPRNRMELYRIALEILVQRRDADRLVPSALDVPLSLTDRICVLQDLAWRLSDNNRSEIAWEQAATHVGAKTAAMRHLDGVDGQALLDHLVARSGVLRSPAEGRVDFLHRTFQEYLAAAEAAAEDRMGNLIERAHLDLWRETVVMAAGHANRSQREELIGGVLARASAEPRRARGLRLLAASCLETMTTVPEGVAGQLEDALSVLLPPRRRTDAEGLAGVGLAALRRLPESLDGLSEKAAIAVVRTAAVIGGDEALERLARYAGDWRPGVRSELVAVWQYFDPHEYARRVLAQLPLARTWLSLTHPTQWLALLELPQARSVSIRYAFKGGLAATDALGELDRLWLPMLRDTDDLSPLRHRLELISLSLWGNVPLHDVEPLRELTSLKVLVLQDWLSLPPLEAVPVASELQSLGLGRLSPSTDLGRLTDLKRLHYLLLQGSGAPHGLIGLGTMERLGSLHLEGYNLSEWLHRQQSLPPKLVLVGFRNCVVPRDLGPLSTADRLHTLRLFNCRTPDNRPLALHTLARTPTQSKLTVRITGSTPYSAPASPIPGVRIKRH
ncbi:NACHT domain-containing protein [Streptomyces sp. BPTC-684]|uniref:NACHT domain-containing protein n=1 Tax=Streptomyces sp. BPTC-684 TaxID=3043734 RepID=UPI0024B1F6B9|nr:NACHT domain-containing protein [Streptomyces sp. BPTC-684]WHM36397.1 NACHT domain-containing protein [Streptomyces sp. BPTC-684]